MIKDLGHPKLATNEVINQLLDDTVDPDTPKRSNRSTLWLVILGILSAPMSIIVIALLFAILVTILSLIFAFFVTVFVFFLASFVLGVALIWEASTNFLTLPIFLVELGAAAILLGFTLLFGLMIAYLLKYMKLGLVRLYQWLMKKLRKGE